MASRSVSYTRFFPLSSAAKSRCRAILFGTKNSDTDVYSRSSVLDELFQKHATADLRSRVQCTISKSCRKPREHAWRPSLLSRGVDRLILMKERLRSPLLAGDPIFGLEAAPQHRKA
jgi:hypothetical protein